MAVHQMSEADTRIDLRRALPCLTEKQAEALGLWIEGYSQREVGERLGVSQQAVARLIARGLSAIRATMGL